MNASVVIATYGDEHWKTIAERAYLSALGQDAHDIVVYHGGDTIAQSRNDAAARAQGDWLCFLDADDELAPGYLEAMGRALEQQGANGVRLLLTPAVRHVRRGRPAPPFFFDRGISLRVDNWLVVGTLVHKDLFYEVGGFGDYPHGFEDFSLWSKCFRAGAAIVKVPDAVYVYYYNAQSEHKKGWRDRRWQRETHNRVVSELDAWEADRA